jgi:hypothetical protein
MIKSPIKIIREHCVECSGGSAAEVKLCPVTKCKLWPYRFGRNPNRAKKTLTEEQRDIIRKRLGTARTSQNSVSSEQGGDISGGGADASGQ